MTHPLHAICQVVAGFTLRGTFPASGVDPYALSGSPAFAGMTGVWTSPASGALLARVNLRFAKGVVGLVGFVRR